jgi:hypothetical protein
MFQVWDSVGIPAISKPQVLHSQFLRMQRLGGVACARRAQPYGYTPVGVPSLKVGFMVLSFAATIIPNWFASPSSGGDDDLLNVDGRETRARGTLAAWRYLFNKIRTTRTTSFPTSVGRRASTMRITSLGAPRRVATEVQSLCAD